MTYTYRKEPLEITIEIYSGTNTTDDPADFDPISILSYTGDEPIVIDDGELCILPEDIVEQLYEEAFEAFMEGVSYAR